MNDERRVNRRFSFGHKVGDRCAKTHNKPRNKSCRRGSNPGPSSSALKFFVVNLDEPTALFAVDDPLGWQDDSSADSWLTGVGWRGLRAWSRKNERRKDNARHRFRLILRRVLAKAAWRLVRVLAFEPFFVTFLAYAEVLMPAFLAFLVKAPGRLMAFLIQFLPAISSPS